MKKLSFVVLMVVMCLQGWAQPLKRSPLTAPGAASDHPAAAFREQLPKSVFPGSTLEARQMAPDFSSVKAGKNHLPLGKLSGGKVFGGQKNLQAVIWTNDFSASTGWVITHTTGTTGDWVIGTTGPSGSYSISPIASTTASNGFGKLDSDVLCTGNIVANLTTPTINCLGHPSVRLVFQQYYRRWYDSTFVYVSGNNGTTWSKFVVNSALANNGSTANPEITTLNISTVAGNSSQVKIRFQYYSPSTMGTNAGCGYAWMVDDVIVEDIPAADASVSAMFTLGKLPVSTPHQVVAKVKNEGGSALTNLNVTLNVTGANTFTNVKTIASLAVGAETTVTFDAYSAANQGANSVTVSVGTDANNSNNSKSYYQLATPNVIAYADTSDFSGGLGYNTGAGLMLCKYTMSGVKTVQNVNIGISTDADSPGNVIYAVVLNSAGTIVGQSANYTLLATDLGTIKSLAIPQTPSFANEVYYVGIAQTANATTGYYPLGTQDEVVPRTGAYYISGLTGGTFTEANTYGQFVIEAQLGTPQPYDAGVTQIVSPSNASSCALSAASQVTVTIKNFGGNTITNFPVKYQINNGTPVTGLFTGSIAPGATSNFTFTTTANLSAQQYYTIYAWTVLTNDATASNDTTETLVVNGNATIGVTILTDDYGSETYWGVWNSDGLLVDYGGLSPVYANNTLINETVCVLSTDCYSFTIFDDYGDGISSPGYYEVSYNSTVVGGNSAFLTDQESLYNLGGGCPQFEGAVNLVYTLGKLPIQFGSPTVVSAHLTNWGTQTLANLPVTLTISGANSFTVTNTVTIPSLTDTVISFPAFTPAALGQNNVVVSIPSDEDNSNNSASYYQMVNTNTFSYADTSEVASSIGYGTGNGLLFVKYLTSQAAMVQAVNVTFGSDVSSVGNTVYGVLMNADTVVIAQTADYIIQPTDPGTVHAFQFNPPVSIAAGRFFVGLAQTANATTGYYPLGTQEELIGREDAYFGASELNGDTTSSYTTLGRFAIEAVVGNLPPWSYSITGQNHTVLVVGTLPATIDGSPIQIGDYIGVFYDSLGTLACAGFCMWTGENTVLAAWGADAGSVNGLASNEVFKWKIWKNSTNTVVPATATYDLTFPNQGNFAVNGLSSLATLTALTTETHNISLNQGWNIFSTYIIPPSLALSNVLAPIAGQFKIVKNGTGQVYWPQFSVNTIGNMVTVQGYQILMFSAQVLPITGQAVVPQTTPINLSTGWSILAYLRKTAASPVTMMATIVSQIKIMKNGAGAVYWPQFNINTIGTMQPGQGYQILMLSGATYYYPANTDLLAKAMDTPALDVVMSGSNMTIGIPLDAWDRQPAIGDLIQAFDGRSQLVGTAVFSGKNLALTVFGSDPLTGAAGPAGDEPVFLRMRNAGSGEWTELRVVDWAEGNGNFKENGVSVVGNLLSSGLILDQNSPNPASLATEIGFSLPESGNVEITLFDMTGQQVDQLLLPGLQAGKHMVRYSTAILAPGRYIYAVSSNGQSVSRSMTVVR